MDKTRRAAAPAHKLPQVRKAPSWSRSWANCSLLWLYSYWNAWANLHLLGQPNSFLAEVFAFELGNEVNNQGVGPDGTPDRHNCSLLPAQQADAIEQLAAALEQAWPLVGASISETAMRPDPRRARLPQGAARGARGGQGGAGSLSYGEGVL